jgi:hypothetical protein
MAFPTGMSTANYVSVAGITLGLFPSDQSFDVELQRSTAAAAPTSKWNTIKTFGMGNNAEIVYQDILPLTTKLAYYKARHVKTGYTAGAFSTVVSAKPKPLWLNSQAGFGSTAIRQLKTITSTDGVSQQQTNTASRYRCAAAASAAANSIVNNTPTALAFDSESIDNGSIHDNAVNNSRFTIPTTNVAGVWVFICTVSFAADGTGTGFRMARIDLNGSTLLVPSNTVERTIVGTVQPEVMQVLRYVVNPTPGDYYECWVVQTSGGNLAVTGRMDVVHLW